jgi:hypothetical protein
MSKHNGVFLTVAVLAVSFLVVASAWAADRVIGYETADILESVPGAAASWERISGTGDPYPQGIHINPTQAFVHSGSYAAYMVSGWQENNGDLVYRVVTRSTKVSFWYLLAVGTLDGHQGYYYFSIDGDTQLGGRVPAVRYNDGGTGWLYAEVTGLSDTVHTFEWRLVDKDYYTSSWFFWDDVTFSPLRVDIDIKPGSDPNAINLGSEGVIPVAILGSDLFDVHDINQESLMFEGNEARRKGKKEKIGAFEDVNEDGFVDMVVQFATSELELSETDTEATLTGILLDGTTMEGTDSIVIVPPEN